MSGEFELITRYWKREQALHHAQLGIGDDCALIQPLAGEELAVSTDTLMVKRHFFSDVDAYKLGYKALAVNLSDLASCGAKPLAFTLALSLEQTDEEWLKKFSKGLWKIADEYQCDLIGGDTTGGVLSICITAFGSVPKEDFIYRQNAQIGDDIYVSTPNDTSYGLGDARLALHLLQIEKTQTNYTSLEHLSTAQRKTTLQAVRDRLEQPQPRLALGLALRKIANCAIDLSDGLAGDIQHIIQASKVGCTLYANHSDGTGLQAALGKYTKQHLSAKAALNYALQGGDDYELLFTAAPKQRENIAQIANMCNLNCTRIGYIEKQPGLRWQALDGNINNLDCSSFDHFAS